MRIKKKLRRSLARKNIRGKTGKLLTEFVTLTLCAFFALTVSITSKLLDFTKTSEIYAAAEETDTEETDSSDISDVFTSLNETVEGNRTVNRIGTSCEDVMVGQRVQVVESVYSGINLSESMEQAVELMDRTVTTLSASPAIMSDEDYETLLKIVEAEAGTEDLKGRILVANVIMNRVKHEEFPDTITDVVYEYRCGVPQFSPVYDGRIYRVTVSEQTREAVKQAIEGVDYSEGALFFVYKEAAEKDNVEWFEKELKSLFKHGVHEFYRYPEEGEIIQPVKETEVQEEVIQMAKNDILE